MREHIAIDAATTSASLVAQYLLTRKRLESWWVWIAVDIVYVPLYLSRGLPLTALLYVLFLGLCVSGLRSWRVSWQGAAAEPVTMASAGAVGFEPGPGATS